MALPAELAPGPQPAERQPAGLLGWRRFNGVPPQPHADLQHACREHTSHMGLRHSRQAALPGPPEPHPAARCASLSWVPSFSNLDLCRRDSCVPDWLTIGSMLCRTQPPNHMLYMLSSQFLPIKRLPLPFYGVTSLTLLNCVTSPLSICRHRPVVRLFYLGSVDSNLPEVVPYISLCGCAGNGYLCGPIPNGIPVAQYTGGPTISTVS